MEPAIHQPSIRAIASLIAPHIRVTPVITIPGAEVGAPRCTVTLKLENLQHAGSFKTRGAFANLMSRPIPPAGIAAASGGNHGAAVAYAANRLGIRAKVFVPTISSPAKIDRIQSCGAELVVTGDTYGDALTASEEWVAASGALPVHAFDQTETLLGQGTLGMEMNALAPELDTILVAVGGGGLIGGIAAWYRGSVRVIGVEPELSPTLTAALHAGRPVDAPVGGIAADSLAPRRVGELMFPIARAFVERVVLVKDSAIATAQETLWDALRIVTEPGGATAFAALHSGAYVPAPGERVGVVLSGGNTTAVNFAATSRRVDVFFYGLFMDEALLRSKGAQPLGGERAVVDGFVLRIGERATLVSTDGGHVHGLVFSLTSSDLDQLYSDPGLRAYKPQAVLARLESGAVTAAVCYNLQHPPKAAEHNAEYAANLRAIAKKVGLPEHYVATAFSVS
jgi:threonine dehydratase